MWIDINIRYEDSVRVEVTDGLTKAEIQEVAEEVALGLSNIITAEHVTWHYTYPGEE